MTHPWDGGDGLSADAQPELPPGRTLARIYMLSAVGIWGSTFVVTKAAYAEVGPITLAALRFALATLLLLPPAIRQGGFRSTTVLPLALLGLSGVTAFFTLQNLGVYFTSATAAGLILGSIPAFTLVCSAVFLKERITLLRGVGVATSMLGVSVIVLAGEAGGDASNPVLGNLLVLGGALSWALYTVLGKATVERLPRHAVAAGSVTFGFVFLVPLALLETRLLGYRTITPSGWLAVAYLGIAASGLAFWLWNMGIRSVSASEAGTFTNLSPVVSVITATALLGETPGVSHIAGGLMVILGVYLAGLPGRSTGAAHAD
ncbi:MAG: EamA family transporter [Bacillota bacterium]